MPLSQLHRVPYPPMLVQGVVVISETTPVRKPFIAKVSWSTCPLLIVPVSQSEDCVLKIIAVIDNAAVLRVTK